MEHVNPASTMFLGPVTPADIAETTDREARSVKPFYDNQNARFLLAVKEIYSYSRCAPEDFIELFGRQGFSIIDKATRSEVNFRAAT